MHVMSTNKLSLKTKRFFLCKQKSLSLEHVLPFLARLQPRPCTRHGSTRDYNEQIYIACTQPLSFLNKDKNTVKPNKGNGRDISFATNEPATFKLCQSVFLKKCDEVFHFSVLLKNYLSAIILNGHYFHFWNKELSALEKKKKNQAYLKQASVLNLRTSTLCSRNADQFFFPHSQK